MISDNLKIKKKIKRDFKRIKKNRKYEIMGS